MGSAIKLLLIKTGGVMGNRGSLHICMEPAEIWAIEEETGFTPGQIDRLHTRFRKLDVGNNGYLQRQDLLRIPELAINPLGDRIIHAFFFDNEDDKLEFKDFVNVLSFFRPVSRKSWKNLKNTKKDKLMFSFRMYDLDNDGSMSVDNIEEAELCKIAEKFVQEIDHSQDTLISFEGFVQIMDASDVEHKMSMKFVG